MAKPGPDARGPKIQTNTSKQWKLLADSDLNTAEFLVNNMYPTPHEIVCFHCQQAAEKYLKCFLTEHGEEPPYTHDLDELCKSCEKHDNSFSTIANWCTVLTQFGVQPRYDPRMDIKESDMLLALNNAKALKEFVKNSIPDVFKEAEQEADSSGL
jgi:HEPN domain-containing protein